MIYIKNLIAPTDTKFDISLPFGTLYKSANTFYVIGSKPIGGDYTSETETHKDFRHIFKDEKDELGYMEEYTYQVTTYKSILSAEEVINKFIELIKETAVIIKDSEFFLKYPIVTTGIAKVFMDNCVAHIEGEGFIKISGCQGGEGYNEEELKEFNKTLDYVLSKSTTISNNLSNPMEYHKYGSQNKEDFLVRHFPQNTEYNLKVNTNDKVLKSHTDKRGYPASCGIENKEKDIVIIVRGKQ